MNFLAVDRAAGTIILQSLEKPDTCFLIYICNIIVTGFFFPHFFKHQDMPYSRYLFWVLEMREKCTTFKKIFQGSLI
jgi:hypothetical protein